MLSEAVAKCDSPAGLWQRQMVMRSALFASAPFVVFRFILNAGVVGADSIRRSLERWGCAQIISAPTRNWKAIDRLYNRYANANIY